MVVMEDPIDTEMVGDLQTFNAAIETASCPSGEIEILPKGDLGRVAWFSLIASWVQEALYLGCELPSATRHSSRKTSFVSVLIARMNQ